jgi:hypothetical protein
MNENKDPIDLPIEYQHKVRLAKAKGEQGKPSKPLVNNVKEHFDSVLREKGEAWAQKNAAWIKAEKININKMAVNAGLGNLYPGEARAQSQQQSRPQPQANTQKKPQESSRTNSSQGFNKQNSRAQEEPTHANITSLDLAAQIMKVQNDKGREAASKLKQDITAIMEKEGVAAKNVKGETRLTIIGELSNEQVERYTKMANNLANGQDINKGFTTIDLKSSMNKAPTYQAQSAVKANLAKIMKDEGVSAVNVKGWRSLEVNAELNPQQVERYKAMAAELAVGKTPEQVKADPKFNKHAKAQQESQQSEPQPQATQKEQNNSSTQSKQAEKGTKFTPEQQKKWDDLQAKRTNPEDSKKSTQSKTDSPETEHLKKPKLVKRLTNKVKNKVNKIIDKIKGKAHVRNGGTNTPPPAGKNKGKGQSTGNSL